MTDKPPAKDRVATAHAVVFFLFGAACGGGTDLVVSHFWGDGIGQTAGFAGFVVGLLLARTISRRWFPDGTPLDS